MSNPRPLLALDFDGVLASYDGWQGFDHIGDPVAGALAFVRAAATEFDLVIVSARARDDRGRAAIRQWLSQHGFPVIPITDRKPPALVTLDDRAITFRGAWPDIAALRRFRTWYEAEQATDHTMATWLATLNGDGHRGRGAVRR